MTYDRATTPLLTAADERHLASQIEEGRAAVERLDRGEGRAGDDQARARGERARRHFIEANLRLVLSIASKVRAPDHVDRQDMIQDGMIGLERAVEKFDGRKGYKFSTYATWWIRQSIQRGLENTACPIRIPSERTIALNQALGEVDGDFNQLPAKLAALAATAHVSSLDRFTLDGDATVADSLADVTGGPEVLVLDAARRAAVREMLDRLDPFDRQVVERRFGLDGRDGATFSQISAEVGIGAEAARRRVLRALQDLRVSAGHLAA